MNSSLQPARKLRSFGIFALSLRILSAMLLTSLAFAPLRLYAQGLTGTYTADDGGIYYVQQSGSVLWWAGLSLDSQLTADKQWHRGLSFTNVFRGNITSDGTITGEWADVSRGTTLNSGKLTLAIGNSGGVPQLTKTAVTGGFGGTTWTQTNPLDDTLFNGSALDIISRFDAVHKNDNSTIHKNLKPYRDQTVFYGRVINSHAEYLCSGSVGFVVCSNHPVESEPPHVNYGSNDFGISSYPNFGQQARDFQTFACSNPGGDGDKDGDFDMRLKVDLNKLEPDFYTTGWGDRTSGPKVFTLKLTDSSTQTKLNFAGSEGYVGLESLTYGKAGTCSSLQDGTYGYASLLPGWADLYSASVLINGRPINGSLSSPQSNGCNFIQPCPYVPVGVDSTNYLGNPIGLQLGKLLISSFGNGKVDPNRDPIGNSGAGTYMRVTGTLILDCGHFVESLKGIPPLPLGYTCFDDNPDGDPNFVSLNQNQEVHPIYSIDIINSPFRPEDDGVNARSNLTGAWGGSDGSTYYIRQIGNTVWWLGMMRDRQPIMRGTAFDIIGMPQVAAAGLLVGSPICPTGTECWVFASVFKGTLTENSDGSATIKGDWAGVPQSTSAGSTGSTGVTFTVSANRKLIKPVTLAGLFPPLQKLYEPEDTTPPQSMLTIGTPQYPAGAALPFVSSATPLTISATDQESGVQNLWYRLFPPGATPPAYTPVVGSNFTFNLNGADGNYVVDFYATDNAGNDENLRTLHVVDLDNTPPVATILAPAAAQYGHSDSFVINYSASDGTGSGVKSAIPNIDGLTTLLDGTQVALSQTVNLLTALALGTHTFNVVSTDNVNNTGTNSVTFSVIVTAESIKKDVTQFVAAGKITVDSGNSLLGILNAAATARAVGKCATASQIYQAFIKQVTALSGKQIDPAAAQIMLLDAQYLIAHCP